jgi:hypothetical protein
VVITTRYSLIYFKSDVAATTYSPSGVKPNKVSSGERLRAWNGVSEMWVVDNDVPDEITERIEEEERGPVTV